MSRNSFRQHSEYLLFRLFTGLVRLSPRALRNLLARAVDRLFRRFSRRHHRMVQHNLELAFPAWDERRRADLQAAVYRHYSRLLVDLAALIASRRPQTVADRLDIRGADHLKRALQAERGAVVFSAHLGNWELLPPGISRVIGAPVVAVARPLDNRLIDRRLHAFRTHLGSRLVDKHGAMRSILKALDRKETVLMLIDQNTVVREGVFVEFFGHRVSTVTSAAQLHLRRGTPLVPAFVHLEAGRPVLEFHAPLNFRSTENREKDITALTQRCTAEIEAAIRRHPEQWLWFHNRWKTRPKGEQHATQRPRRRPAAPHPH